MIAVHDEIVICYHCKKPINCIIFDATKVQLCSICIIEYSNLYKLTPTIDSSAILNMIISKYPYYGNQKLIHHFCKSLKIMDTKNAVVQDIDWNFEVIYNPTSLQLLSLIPHFYIASVKLDNSEHAMVVGKIGKAKVLCVNSWGENQREMIFEHSQITSISKVNMRINQSAKLIPNARFQVSAVTAYKMAKNKAGMPPKLDALINVANLVNQWEKKWIYYRCCSLYTSIENIWFHIQKILNGKN